MKECVSCKETLVGEDNKPKVMVYDTGDGIVGPLCIFCRKPNPLQWTHAEMLEYVEAWQELRRVKK